MNYYKFASEAIEWEVEFASEYPYIYWSTFFRTRISTPTEKTVGRKLKIMFRMDPHWKQTLHRNADEGWWVEVRKVEKKCENEAITCIRRKKPEVHKIQDRRRQSNVCRSAKAKEIERNNRKQQQTVINCLKRLVMLTVVCWFDVIYGWLVLNGIKQKPFLLITLFMGIALRTHFCLSFLPNTNDFCVVYRDRPRVCIEILSLALDFLLLDSCINFFLPTRIQSNNKIAGVLPAAGNDIKYVTNVDNI